jgi:enoyl-CoA hydratase/carnithine racemase
VKVRSPLRKGAHPFGRPSRMADNSAESTAVLIGNVGLIQFRSPPYGILTAAGTRMLLKLFREMLANADVRAIVLAGAEPGIFIRHYDLNDIVRSAEAVRSGIASPEAFLDSDFALLTDLIAASPIPVIAAINGMCMGGGFEIALACDIRVAQDDVVHIGLPEVRIDIFPGGGGTQRLARLVGRSAAMDIALRGRTIDSRRAYELGIVGDVVPDALRASLAVATTLSRRDRTAIATIKRLVNTSLEAPLADGLKDERLSFAAHLRDCEAAVDSMRQLLTAGTMLETAPGCEPE